MKRRKRRRRRKGRERRRQRRKTKSRRERPRRKRAMRRGPLGSGVEETDRENCKQELSRAAVTAPLQSLARALLSSKGQKVFYSASSPP